MTMKTPEQVRDLINIAQEKAEGDTEFRRLWAQSDLIADILEYHMHKHIGKYLRKITVSGLDEDDLRQTFIIACGRALLEADVTVGDPMLYICQKGKWAVVDLLRKHYRKDLRQYCHTCSTETRLHERGGQMVCPKCGESADGKVERITRDGLDDGTQMGTVVSEEMDLQERVASQLIIDDFETRLSGRSLDVFKLIIHQGYDRDSCQNYIKEVAAALEVTPANVNMRLRQIKEKWHEFTAEVSAMDEIMIGLAERGLC